MGLGLFDDLPDLPAAPASSSLGLFDDIPDQQAGRYENGQRVGADIPPVAALDDAGQRTGGAGFDRTIGSRTGMLSGDESYRLKQEAEAAARAELERRSAVIDETRADPVDLYRRPNPLTQFQIGQRAAEERITGRPVEVAPILPNATQAATIDTAEAERQRQRALQGAEAGFDTALKKQVETVTNQPESQKWQRNAAESAMAGLIGIPAGAMDAVTIAGDKVASLAGGDGTALREVNQLVQQYANGLAKPDPAQADRLLTSQLPQGIGSTFGFGLAGQIGKTLGLSAKATTALAGALPQASQLYREAEAKGASEAEKWVAFAGGLGLGSLEVLPIANTLERWSNAVPGFRQAARDTMLSFGEEAATEGLQQIGGNTIAGMTFDPSRSIGEGVAESMAVGGLTGGLMGGAGSFGQAAMMRGEAAQPQIPLPQAPGLDPSLQNIPAGAQPAEVLLGPDPSMVDSSAENSGLVAQQPPQPQRSDPRFELQALLDDPRPVAEIRAEMEAKGLIPAAPNPLMQQAEELRRAGDIAGADLLERQAIGKALGTRSDPIRIDSPEAVTDGAERTALPTQAQAEAGNYAKRHVKWNGLDVSIETEAGQDRKGVGPDGTPWSVTLPAPYGYIKRTTGADGDQIDVYLGPNPQGSVFVIDQIDPDTGRFDEHKVMLGFDSREQAQAYYDAGFSDGRGPERAGAVSEIPKDQFRQWTQNGNLKRPISYDPPLRAGLTQDQFRSLRGIIRDTTDSLDPAKIAPMLGAKTADIRNVLSRLAGVNEVKLHRDGRFSRLAKRGGPTELLQFIGQRGGIESKQAQEVRDLDKVFLPGIGRIARPRGRNLDETREAAVEAGYLPEGATIADLLDAIDWSARGRKTFSMFDTEQVLDQQEKKQQAEITGEITELFADAIAELGVNPTYADLLEADDLLQQGMAKALALETAIERNAMRSLEEAHSSGWMSDEDWQQFDQAFIADAPAPAPQQERTDDGSIAAWFRANRAPKGDGAGAPEGGERQGPRPREEEGAAPTGQQPREAGEPAREVSADDSDEAVEQRLTAEGPWDFNDAYPETKRGASDIADVAGVAEFIENQISEMQQAFIDEATLRAQIQQIGEDRTEDGRVKNRMRLIDAAQKQISDAYTLLDENFSDTAVAAIVAEARRRAGQERRTTGALPSSADREERAPKPTAEHGAEGKPQLVIPGAERIGQGEQAQRAADKPLRASAPQKDAGGLFGDDAGARQLFDDIPSRQEESPSKVNEKDIEPPKSAGLAKIKAKRETAAPTQEEIYAQIDAGFAQNREAMKGFKVGDTVSYVSPGTYRQKDGTEIVDPVRTGKITKVQDKGQGVFEVGGNTYIGARKLTKVEPKPAAPPAQQRRDALETGTPPIEDDRERQRRENVAKLEAVEPVKPSVDSGPKREVKGTSNTVFTKLPARSSTGGYDAVVTRDGVSKVGYGATKAEAEADALKQFAAANAAKGASNTVFTADKAAAARARLKAKLSGAQLNSGLDPEAMLDGLTLAGFHIEAGARSFAAYTKAMVEDLGESVRPYLRGWYENVRYYPGFDADGMSSAAEIEAEPQQSAGTDQASASEPVEEADTADQEAETKLAEARARVPEFKALHPVGSWLAAENDQDVNKVVDITGHTDGSVAIRVLSGYESERKRQLPGSRNDVEIRDGAVYHLGDKLHRLTDEQAAAVMKLRYPLERRDEINRILGAPPENGQDTPSPGRNGNKSERETIAEAVRSELVNGATYKTIREARALAEKATGGKITPSIETAKLIDEAVELGVVLAARDIVAEGKGPAETFDALLDLYNRQPSLNVRTSTSMLEQAYSTPVPLAYVGSRLAGIDGTTTVYEPSAGNGALLIEADPDKTVANELNPDRRRALEAQGFDPLAMDAASPAAKSKAFSANDGNRFDVVIANPPFGVVKDDEGNSRSFKVDDRYTTNEIDHAIAIDALRTLKDDGRAVLIVGGVNKLATTQAARSNAYNGKAKREFYLTLYQEYNVTDHFTVSGDLYAKQGAGYPVDVIVIDGRGKSTRKVPAAQVPPVLTTWQEVKGKLNDTETAGSTQREAVEPAGRTDAAGSETGLAQSRDGMVGGRADTARRGEQPVRGAEPVGPDGSRERPATGQAQLESERRVQPGDAGQDGSGVQRRSTVAQQAQPSLFDTDSSAETAPAVDSKAEAKPRQAPAPAVPAAADMSKPQVPYRPRSNAHPMGTLVPVNMQTTSQEALTSLEKRVGNIDEFVARELGYKPDELADYFGAEQVDGIALGIDNFAKGAGVIIGDQTGIGKGRQVAGILRWAIRKGRVPIFVTEKPNLYADMFRDMQDIGINDMLGRDIKVFMTNSGERVPLDDEGKKALTSPQAGPHQAEMNKMIEAGKPTGYDMIFTTYAQMQTVKGEETVRQKFLRAMAGANSVLALDEAHNAGGQQQTIIVKKDGKEPMTRAKFVRELLGLTSAALYSSATYAKRPDVMDLYFKTDMALAVDDISKLGDLIQKGGIPMQQIVAAMLSRAGQYVRRERSFDGITYDTPLVSVDTAKYEEFSRNIALIQFFSENFVSEAVGKMDQDLKEEGRSVATDNSTGGAGASSTNFTAVMHNIVNQILLSMKAQDAADRAIAALRRGEKPVITLANTNEAFIDEYAENVGAQVGDAVAIRFNDVLLRYLERSRMVTIKKPFAKAGDTERLRLTDQQLGPAGVAAFNDARKSIEAADFSGLPVSPIDWIRSQVVSAGYSVSEITGRGLTLDYQISRSKTAKGGDVEIAEPRAILKMRPGAEKSIAGRRAAIGGYNSGKIDVLILNQSGSTGLSLHASEKVLNKNKRRMILAQPENNIDTHMQMLGRVNRTGQVVKPAYDQLVADIPAEKRPASILSKKMASLNANTTGARDSAVTAKDTPDFMNSYGDMVAAMVMRENPDLNARLGDPISPEAEDFDGAMRKVTGRIPLLPLKEQENLYDLLQAEYEALIQQLEASGQNALEAKTLELDAKVIEAMEVKQGKNADSPFADAVYFEKVDVKRLGKPMSPDQVVAAIAKAMGVSEGDGTAQQKLTVLAGVGRGLMKDIGGQALRDFTAFKTSERARIKDEGKAKQNDTKLEEIKRRWNALLDKLTPGQGVVMKTDEGNFYGVVVETSFSGRAKNPLALSAWRAQIALADPARSMTLPFSQIYTEATRPEKPGPFEIEIDGANSIGSMPLLDAFEDMQAERREERIVITGNILAGYDFVSGSGQIVNFTDNEGRLRQGILMRRGFDAEKFLSKKAVVLRDGQQVQTYLDRVANSMVTSADTFITVRKAPNGDTQIGISAARQNGGRYFLSKPVLDAARRDFVKVGDQMRLEVPPYRAREVLDALIKAGASFEVKDNLDIAREIAGRIEFSPASAPKGWDVVEAEEELPLTKKQQQELTDIIRRTAGRVGLAFPDRIMVRAGQPGADAWGQSEDFEALGSYRHLPQDLIQLSMRGAAPFVAYHEAFHRLQTLALTPAQQAVLREEAPRLKKLLEGSLLNREVDKMGQREIEADAFGLFATARDRGEVPEGFPARVRVLWDKLYQLIRAVRNALKGMGFQTSEGIFEQAWRGDLAGKADRTATRARGGPPMSEEFSIPPGAPDTIQNRRNVFWQALAKGQPLDRAMRIPFDLFGALDSENRWTPGVKLDETARRIITEAKIDPNGRFGWLSNVVENARAGLIDRYGQDPEYTKRDRQRANDERAVLAQGEQILAELMKRNLSAEESKVLQAMLTGEAVSEGEMGALAEPIRVAIDQLGAEAVQLGLISAESYERNRGAYLHRVYTKDLQAQPGLTKFAERLMTSRRKHIIGDQLKGRGIFMEITMERLLRDDPEFHSAARGKPVKGEKFRMIQQIREQVTTDGEVEEKETRRIWWPADRQLPAKWEHLRDAGTWEVRAVDANGKATVWRDYTKDERTRMGEILDARYTIAKTYSGMAQDLASGRFFKDIAENEDWSQAQAPDQTSRDAGEYGRFWNDSSIEWVKVPDTAIPDTGGKKRWGALAGRYVRAEIWRDMNETFIAQTPSTWRRLYGIWKLNKTARSPVTHMNNVMSNLMFMDMADIRLQDLSRGIRSFIKKDQLFREASDNGAFGNDMMAVEFKREVLQPLLDEITAQQTPNAAKNPWFAKAAIAGKMADTIWSGVKAADKAMIDAYRIEDELFRMATFIRRREMGDTPQQAADFARRQFLDYGIRAPWVAAARNTVLPFISYVYRAVPLIAQALAYRPWKLAKYFAVAYAMNALAYGLDDEGDEERERASMRKEEQGWLWTGVPRMMRMPWRDANGLPVFLDIRRWTPAGDIFDAGQGSTALPLPAPLMPGGPIALGFEFALNKIGFTGKTITNDRTDTWWEAGGKVGDWAWKSIMPNAPWVPGSWSGERVANAWRGGTDRAGNPLSLKEAVSSAAGIKLAGRDIEQGFAVKFYELRKTTQDLQQEARTLARQRQRNLISQDVFERELADIVSKRKKVAQDTAALAKQNQPRAQREAAKETTP